MTDAEIDAIEARAKAATEGPWRAGTTIACPHGRPADERRNIHVGVVDVTAPCAHLSTEDASFIAAAREDVPALVAEVRRLRRELQRTEALEERVERLAGSIANLGGDVDADEPKAH